MSIRNIINDTLSSWKKLKANEINLNGLEMKNVNNELNINGSSLSSNNNISLLYDNTFKMFSYDDVNAVKLNFKPFSDKTISSMVEYNSSSETLLIKKGLHLFEIDLYVTPPASDNQKLSILPEDESVVLYNVSVVDEDIQAHRYVAGTTLTPYNPWVKKYFRTFDSPFKLQVALRQKPNNNILSTQSCVLLPSLDTNMSGSPLDQSYSTKFNIIYNFPQDMEIEVVFSVENLLTYKVLNINEGDGVFSMLKIHSYQ